MLQLNHALPDACKIAWTSDGMAGGPASGHPNLGAWDFQAIKVSHGRLLEGL
jgi:hypothetical protein